MKKTVLVAVVACLLSIPFAFPKTSQAFWPFDRWFQKGEVKGDNITTSATLTVTSPSGTVGAINPDVEEDQLTEGKLLTAVKNKTITQAQKNEILAKLKAIKAKREELRKMREYFTLWLKKSKIDRKKLLQINVETRTGNQTNVGINKRVATPSGAVVKRYRSQEVTNR